MLTVIASVTNDFNHVSPNGTWRLLVQNPGHNLGGKFPDFMLKIYFYQ